MQEAANLTAGSMSRTSPVCDFYAENVLSGGDQERLEMLFDALLRRPDIDADMIKKFESKLEEKKKELK